LLLGNEMSVNIMDLVKGAVSDQVMGQIGGLLGTDAKKTPSLFETAAGSILGGLMKKGATQQGAQDIFGAVQQQDDSILDKLGDLLGGGDATDAYQKQGTGILDMAMGGSQQTSGLVGTIANALGLDKGIMGKLLMMAAPIVMGVIGKHIKNKALDAVGLGSLLGEQKSHLASVMPSSLTNDLGFGNLLGNVGDAAGSAVGTVGKVGGAASDAVGNAANAAGAMAGNAADAAKSAEGGLLKYIIPIGLLALLAMFGIPKLIDFMSQQPSAKIGDDQITAEPLVGADIPGMDFGSIAGIDELGETGTTLTTGFADIAKGLQDVNDVDGAKSLADKITGFTGDFDGLGLDKLEGTPKAAAMGIVSNAVEAINKLLMGKSEGITGVLKPVIDALMQKLKPYIGEQIPMSAFD